MFGRSNVGLEHEESVEKSSDEDADSVVQQEQQRADHDTHQPSPEGALPVLTHTGKEIEHPDTDEHARNPVPPESQRKPTSGSKRERCENKHEGTSFSNYLFTTNQ